MSSKEKKKSYLAERRLLLGCLIIVLLPAAFYLGGHALKWAIRTHRRITAKKEARQTFDPLFKAMQEQESRKKYDIDKTIRIMHALDSAADDYHNLPQYLSWMARQDYRNVAPEIIEARVEMLKILQELYARSLELEDKKNLWDSYQTILSILSSIPNVDLTSMGLRVNVDREKAEQMFRSRMQQRKEIRKLSREQKELLTRLYTTMIEYSDVFYDYLEEWDRLCIYRDSAWLAVREGDWNRVLAEAEKAVEAAPHDREARLLKARAMVEMYDIESEIQPGIESLLENFIEENPGETAPAFLMMGVLEKKRGNQKKASQYLQQAAVYYPRQAEKLTDMLDAYKQRAFLRKSREGRQILEGYKSMMLGAGFFSPDLQLADLYFDSKEVPRARTKVLDHFGRRRAQGQLDYIISDLAYCYNYLGVDFLRMYPGQFYLDLNWMPTLFGGNLTTKVENRSDDTLHNVSLVLCIQFTEMLRGDYETIMAPESAPVLPAGEKVDFGNLDIDFELFGKKKDVNDIVACRAVLISNEAVVWVDAPDFKIEEIHREMKDSELAGARRPSLQKVLGNFITIEKLQELFRSAEVEFDPGIGSGKWNITLPEELAILRPFFRLKTGEEELTPDENIMKDESIRLTFKEFGLLKGDEQAKKPIDLEINTRYGKVNLKWNPGKEGGYKLEDIKFDPNFFPPGEDENGK